LATPGLRADFDPVVIAKRALPSVVTIKVKTSAGETTGSGFIVDPSGTIVTNLHVIRGAISGAVRTANGDTYDEFKVKAFDERKDLAVIQIAGFKLPALALGDSDTAYQAALTIAQRLAQMDPTNAEWQRDLSLCQHKVGDLFLSKWDLAGAHQSDLAGAQTAYQAALAIAQVLAEMDLANAEWQWDLSVSYQKVGDILRVQDDHAGAHIAYQAALTIAQRLGQMDPTNAAWQGKLSFMLTQIARTYELLGDWRGALQSFQASP
jgi:tetratricopeptide (TPR) repeat protein